MSKGHVVLNDRSPTTILEGVEQLFWQYNRMNDGSPQELSVCGRDPDYLYHIAEILFQLYRSSSMQEPTHTNNSIDS
jgi:hypothetical protein